MKSLWQKSVYIPTSKSKNDRIDFRIDYGLTGPVLTMSVNDEVIAIASRWQVYVTDHTKGLLDAIQEGLQTLKEGKWES